jgi:tripartite-type tricarboxylate transporter receptor subunit TctC
MRIAKSAGFLLMAVLAQPALAQKGSADAAGNFPLRPIRIVIPFTPGSNSDMLARLIGPKMLERWGQQVVVDNRPGAGGSIAGGIVVSSIADGHTLMLSSSAFATSAALGLKLPYDPLRDFAGVTQVASTANVLLVAPSLGVKSAKDLIALAQQKRGQINFASSGVGSGTHYTGELFKLAAKIDVVHVPYKGTPEALTDTMAGRVHYYFSPIMPALSMIKNGRLLALGVTTCSARRCCRMCLRSARPRSRDSSTTDGSECGRRRRRRARPSQRSRAKSGASSIYPTSRSGS